MSAGVSVVRVVIDAIFDKALGSISSPIFTRICAIALRRNFHFFNNNF